jgi:hypothetical protein
MRVPIRHRDRAAPLQPAWIKYKDVAMLVAGALIGMLSSYVASIQQLSTQKQQLLFDQRSKVVREFIELNSSTWRKSDSLLEALSQKLDTAQRRLSAEPRNESLRKQLLTTMQEFGTSSEDTLKALVEEAGDYEAKIDVLLTVVSYLFDEQPEHVAIDVELSGMTEALVAANKKLSVIANPTPEQSVTVAKTWFQDLSSTVAAQRERNIAQRVKINESIRRIAQSTLK